MRKSSKVSMTTSVFCHLHEQREIEKKFSNRKIAVCVHNTLNRCTIILFRRKKSSFILWFAANIRHYLANLKEAENCVYLQHEKP